MEFPKTEAKFLRQWTLVTAIGLTICTGFLIFIVSLSGSININWVLSFLLTISLSFIFGSGFGLLQWLVFKKWLYHIRWWIFVNGIDAAINCTLIWLVYSIVAVAENRSIPFFYFPCIFLPLIQYIFIRKSIQIPFALIYFFSHSISWITSVIIALVLLLIISIFGTLLYNLFSFKLEANILGNILAILIATLTGFIAFACYGFLTGSTLILLLKNPRKINNR
jgi:hypothetical protein